MNDIYINKRHKMVINIILKNKGYITSQDLSKKLNVSDRTIKNDIKEINDILVDYDVKISSKRGEGYKIKSKDRSLIREKLAKDESYYSKEDRRVYEISTLILCHPEGIYLDDIEEELYISRSTLENDLKEVKTLLKKSFKSINLVRRNEMVFFDADEFTLRLFLNKLIILYYDSATGKMNVSKEYVDQVDYINAKKIIINIFKDNGIKLYDLVISDLALYTIMIKDRINMGRQIKYSVKKNKYIINNRKAIRSIAERMFSEIVNEDIESYDEEIQFLMVKICFNNLYDSTDVDNNTISSHIPEKVIDTVAGIIDMLNSTYNIFLMEDDELFVGLCYHISALLNREEYYELVRKDNLTSSMQEDYPFIFDLTLQLNSLFKKTLGKSFDIDDLSYIAARIATSIEKNKPNYKTKRIRVGIISHYGLSYTELLQETLKTAFYPIIEIIGVFYLYDINEVFKYNPDIIIHTFDISDYVKDKDVKTFETTYSLSREGKIELMDLIESVKSEYLISETENIIINKLDEKLFFTGLNLKTKEEVISLLTNMFIINGFVDKNFLDKILEKEKLSTTILNNQAVLLNPLDYNAKENKLGVIILDNDIRWNHDDVRLVFVLSLTKQSKNELGSIIYSINKVTGNLDVMEDILKVKNFDEFIDIISSNI